jgi:hypothetical protein
MLKQYNFGLSHVIEGFHFLYSMYFLGKKFTKYCLGRIHSDVRQRWEAGDAQVAKFLLITYFFQLQF